MARLQYESAESEKETFIVKKEKIQYEDGGSCKIL